MGVACFDRNSTPPDLWSLDKCYASRGTSAEVSSGQSLDEDELREAQWETVGQTMDKDTKTPAGVVCAEAEG